MATLAGHTFSRVVLEIFNKVLGWHQTSDLFWKIDIKNMLLPHFRDALSDTEREVSFDLKKSIDIGLLFSSMFLFLKENNLINTIII